MFNNHLLKTCCFVYQGNALQCYEGVYPNCVTLLLIFSTESVEAARPMDDMKSTPAKVYMD
jgi:hypothetical protein